MTETSHRAVAANVRAELARHKTRHGVAAERLGYTPQAMSRRLSGDVPFTAVDLQRISQLVGVPVDQLLAAPEAAATG